MNMQLLIGRLGQDPDVRFTADGTTVATLSLATTTSWKDKQTGERKEKAIWHRCVMFGAKAEVAQNHFKKGMRLYIEGETQHKEYTDKEGIKRYSTEVRVESFEFLSSKNENTANTQNPGNGENRGTSPADFNDNISF